MEILLPLQRIDLNEFSQHITEDDQKLSSMKSPIIELREQR